MGDGGTAVGNGEFDPSACMSEFVDWMKSTDLGMEFGIKGSASLTRVDVAEGGRLRFCIAVSGDPVSRRAGEIEFRITDTTYKEMFADGDTPTCGEVLAVLSDAIEYLLKDPTRYGTVIEL